MLRRLLIAAALAAASASFTSTAAPAGTVALTATKTVAGLYRPNGAIAYTIVLTNNGTTAQGDNPGPELVDNLAGAFAVTSTSATSGTVTIDGAGLVWDGAIPAGGSVTITIAATIEPNVFGPVPNQAIVRYDADGNGSNESATMTDDPSTPAAGDPTVFTIELYPSLAAVMQVGGNYTPGGSIYYNVYVQNSGGPHGDNPGDEFVDVLPAGIALVGATATIGTVVADVAANTVRWNGALGQGEYAQIQIRARADLTANGTYANQGIVSYDADGNGTNETTAPSDDPSLPGAADPALVTIVQLPAAFELDMYAYSVNDVFERGGVVYFDILAWNRGGTDQGDNPGDEIAAVLPEGLTYESSYALYGTTAFDPVTRRFTWNGTIERNGFVGMTLAARLSATAEGGYSSQATLTYDANQDGTNDTTILSDEPRTDPPNDPAGFQVILPIPALGWPALLIAMAGLALAARARMRRATR